MVVVIDKKFAGAAVQTTVVGSMTPTVPGVGQTFTLADPTGHPTGGNFVLRNSVELSNEEAILCNRSGATCTVVQRGYDGTTPQTHSAGSPCEHRLDAATVTSLVSHVDGLEANPHSGVLLNNAAHDVEARHTFGAALGTPVTPTALTPDIAGAAGSGNNPAREDHVHNVPAAAPGTIQPDDTASEGVAASFARSDHRHEITAATAVSSGLANAEGVATSFARSDHTHDLLAGSVAAASDIADAIIPLVKMASEAATAFANTLGGVSLGGGSKYFEYFKLGRLVVAFWGFVLGGAGDVTSTITTTLPHTPADLAPGIGNTGGIVVGRAVNSSGTVAWSGLGAVLTSTAQDIVTAGAGDVWDSDTPFNWGPGDIFQGLIVYVATS